MKPGSRRLASLLALALVPVLAPACGDDGSRASETPAGPETGFVDRTLEAGIDFHMTFLAGEQGANFKINLYDHGAGVAVADYDGDGDDDLYFANQLGGNALYRNNGDGTFSDVTKSSGPIALADRISSAVLFNDVDNDGDQDLFVTSTRGGNALFQNNGKGRFVDVTKEAGVSWVGHSQGATMFDADQDGDLDLIVTNTAHWTTDVFHPQEKYYLGAQSLMALVESPIEHNAYFRNRGDGTFENATEEAGLAGVGWGGDLAVFDLEDDGDLDLFVGNMFGRSLLYRNDGKGHFENVAGDVLGRTPWGTVGVKAFDFSGDGRLDLYVVDMHSDMWTPFEYDLGTVQETRKYEKFFGPLLESPDFQQWQEVLFAEKTKIQYDQIFFGNGLYRNEGDGQFTEVSDKAGAETFWPWGVAVGDFDNNGYEDAFLASGMGFPWQYWRNPLLMNNGDGTFTDHCKEFGVDPPPQGIVLGKLAGKEAVTSARSAATADFDGDGRLDLVVNNFNDRPNLFLNRWPQNTWIGFRLQGTHCSRDAVGARVRLHAGGRVMIRQVHAAGGYLSQSSKTLHFGLAGATRIDKCEIVWPGGHTQEVEPPEIGRVHTIVEPKSE